MTTTTTNAAHTADAINGNMDIKKIGSYLYALNNECKKIRDLRNEMKYYLFKKDSHPMEYHFTEDITFKKYASKVMPFSFFSYAYYEKRYKELFEKEKYLEMMSFAEDGIKDSCYQMLRNLQDIKQNLYYIKNEVVKKYGTFTGIIHRVDVDVYDKILPLYKIDEYIFHRLVFVEDKDWALFMEGKDIEAFPVMEMLPPKEDAPEFTEEMQEFLLNVLLK